MERGTVVIGGMGGFLCPPEHPEHSYSVRTKHGSYSLSCATTCEWLDEDTRKNAHNLLSKWSDNRPPIDSPGVRDWIHNVLGYFRGCYKGDGAEPECWHVSNLKFGGNSPIENHAGVHLIREYYPEYVPTDGDFENAYWGTKH